MSKCVKVEFEGNTVPAEELEFESEKEPWTSYKLEDGTVLKIKQNLVTICKLVDRYKPDGEPIYVFKMAGITAVDVPAEMKRRAQ